MDPSAQEQAEMAARSYRALGEEFSIALALLGPDLVIRWTNSKAHQILGYPEGALIGMNVIDCLHPDDLDSLLPAADGMVELAEDIGEQPTPASPAEVPARIRRASGGWSEMNVTGRVLDAEGNMLAVVRPAAERHAFDAVLDGLGTGVPLEEMMVALLGLIHSQFRVDEACVVHDVEGVPTVIRSGSGMCPGDPGELLADIRLSEDPKHMRVRGDHWVLPVPAVGLDEIFGAIVLPAPTTDSPSPWDELVGHRTTNLASVAFTRDLNDRLLRLEATTDHLTGIMNRRQFEDNLRDIGRKPFSFPLALFFIDLDSFKLINDRLGHPAGDEVLVVVARRISGAVRSDDWLGRIGGDEFAVCCPGLPLHEVESTRARICAAIAAPMTLETGTVKVTASVGVSTTEDESGLARLIGLSDADMFTRKRTGRRQLGQGAMPFR